MEDGAGVVGGCVTGGAVGFWLAMVGFGVGVVAGGVDSAVAVGLELAVGVGAGVEGVGLGEGSVDAIGDGTLTGSFREWTMMRMRTSPTTSGTVMARMLM